MTDQNEYDALKGVFENMDMTALKFPAMPMGVYLQEAADLYAWMQADKDELVGAGYDWQAAEGLPTRIGAARHAQSIWKACRFARAEAQKQYAEESPAAFDLRDIIVHHMLFAYRDQADVLSRVQAVMEGSGNADMLQDLSDLAVIGRTYPEPLRKINFDVDLLTQADETVLRLSPLLATATGETSPDNEAKLNRDRSYTYLKEAVDEIRVVGQYVFWRDRKRARGYGSDYLRRHRSSAGATTADETAQDEAAATVAG